MKNRVYRAEKLEKVNIKKLYKGIEGKRIVFGIDVAKVDFYGALMNEQREVVKTIKWQSPIQAREMKDFLKALPVDSLEVALEPSGTYGDAFRVLLEQAQISVHLVSPKRSKDASEVYDGVPSSHDAKSAAIIAKLHWDGVSSPWPQKSDDERKLEAAVATTVIYDNQQHQNMNRLEAATARYWPELTLILGLNSVTSFKLLEKYGGPSRVAEEPDEAFEFMRKAARNALTHKKCRLVIASAKETIGVPMIDEERRSLSELAAEILRNREATKKAKARVEQLTVKDQRLETTAQAVGKMTAAVLVTCLGYSEEYDSAGAVVKAAGLNLKERSSGKHNGQLKITKRGPGEVRRYLYFAVLRLIHNDLYCQAWYNKKVKRDGGRYKGRAIVALMRKLLKALWHVGKGAQFDARLMFDISRLDLAS